MKYFTILSTFLISTIYADYDFYSAANCIPYKKGKISSGKCGDDGFIIEPKGSRKKSLIAVSDGVGGWHKHGIDPSLFTDYYLSSMRNNFSAIQESCKLLRFTARQVQTQKTKLKGGSATSLVAIFDKVTGIADVCNVGDSNMMIYRNGTFIFEAGITHHGFNAPYQISLKPNNGNSLVYNPNYRYTQKIRHQKFQLEKGDIIISATDGMFDNLFDKNILSEIHLELNAIAEPSYDCSKNEADLKNLADSISFNLMSNAKDCASKADYKSPFQVEAEKFGKVRYNGGKPDDTTVVVTIVCEKN